MASNYISPYAAYGGYAGFANQMNPFAMSYSPMGYGNMGYGMSPQQQLAMYMMGGMGGYGGYPQMGGYGMMGGYPQMNTGYGYGMPSYGYGYSPYQQPMYQQPYYPQQQPQQQFQPTGGGTGAPQYNAPYTGNNNPYTGKGFGDPNPQFTQGPQQQNPYLPSSMQSTPASSSGPNINQQWDLSLTPGYDKNRVYDVPFHVGNDYESFIAAGGNRDTSIVPTGRPGSVFADNQQPTSVADAYGTSGTTSTSTGTSNTSTSTGTYSDANPWGGLTNRPADW